MQGISPWFPAMRCRKSYFYYFCDTQFLFSSYFRTFLAFKKSRGHFAIRLLLSHVSQKSLLGKIRACGLKAIEKDSITAFFKYSRVCMLAKPYIANRFQMYLITSVKLLWLCVLFYIHTSVPRFPRYKCSLHLFPFSRIHLPMVASTIPHNYLTLTPAEVGLFYYSTSTDA